MSPSLVRETFDGISLSDGSNDDEIYLGDFERDILEPIAVIGFSFKFPQDATSTEPFWDMLMKGRCASTEFPKDRMNRAAFHHPDPSRPGTLPVRGAHFIQGDLGAFDASFFSITPAEAAAIDPQQRGLLETAYRALENAGIPLEKVSGSNTSVHTGCFTADYTTLVCKDPEQMSKYTATGVAGSMVANRISWFFNLNGPSVTLDTACSSSLVALDLACQGLWNGQSTMGLVAGCNLVYSPDMTMALSNMGFLSPDGCCYSFDRRANGYARGEGFGVVVIKLLSEAIRDGDTIRAVIRSTGSNQDGCTPGVTQPSKDSQARLIRDTYHKAGLNLRTTRFVEAHGTGTPLGDPIEAAAIGTAFAHQRSSDEPLYIGAVKANIGHLESTSGIAGLIKTILILERGVIPPIANLQLLNPQIDAEFLNLRFPVKSVPWPVDGLRRASINSFGFGGTNSHAVLDDAYNYLRLRGLAANHCTLRIPPDRVLLNKPSSLPYICRPDPGLPCLSFPEHAMLTTPKLLVWSAADEGGLKRLAADYRHHLAQLSLESGEADVYLNNMAFTLEMRRSSLPWKSFVVADSLFKLYDLEVQLSQPVRSAVKPRLGYVFTGQGAQWYAMGRELLVYSVFKYSLLNAEEYLYGIGCRWSLLGELLQDEIHSKINEAEFSQPICTAVQVAFVDLLRSFGITPSAVVGHSSGEIAAAYCLGALSCRSAWKIAYYRGAVAAIMAKSQQSRGAMISVALSEDEIQPYLEKLAVQHDDHGLSVACINSPKNVTVSGDECQINALKLIMDEEHIFARKLQVNVAYHSPQMNAVATQYRLLINDLEMGDFALRNTTMVSSVTGQKVLATELCQGEYWVRNLVSPVRFSEALGRLCSHSGKAIRKKLDGSHRDLIVINDLLEIGPHSALQGPIRDVLQTISRGREVSYTSILIRRRSALDTMLEAAGRLYCLGHPINLSLINHRTKMKDSNQPLVLPNLPEYSFDHTHTYWHESRLSKGFRFRRHPHLDLLGSPVPDFNPLEARWRNVIKLSEIPWVEDHKINKSILYPAAGMLVMAIEAARQVAKDRPVIGYEIRETTFNTPLNVSANAGGLETEFHLRSLGDASDKSNTSAEFRLCTYENGNWAENCRGTIRVEYEESQTEVDRGKEAREELRNVRQIHEEASRSCTKVVESRYMYQRLRDCGYQYGPTFQPLEQLRCSDRVEATAEVKLLQWPLPHIIHPSSLDGVLQLMFTALTKGGTNTIPTMVPTRVNRLWLSSSGLSCLHADSVQVYAKINHQGFRTVEASISALDKADGLLRIQIEGLETTVFSSAENLSQPESDAWSLYYNIDWKPDLNILDQKEILDYCWDHHVPTKDPAEFFQDLAFLLFSFIVKTLDNIKSRHLEVPKSYLQNYIAWMQLQLDRFETGELPHSRPEWKLLIQDIQYYDNLCNRIEKTNKQGELYVMVGRQLTEMISGEVDPLNVLFQGDLVKEFYQNVNDSANCFYAFGKYLDALAHKNSGMKILEVGAGTGATTGIILNILRSQGEGVGASRYARYDYTDISFSFFEKAKETFKDHQGMNFEVLNIEDDPKGQGFDIKTYDMIIAANVLHATKDLSVTIQNIRKLLKPGGKLVLVEVTRPDILRASFIFGLLPGWWLSTEDYRSLSPCISEQKWHEVLKQNGFSGTELIFRDYETDAHHGFSIIVSTVVELDQNPSLTPRTLVIAEQCSSGQKGLAQQVHAQFQMLGCPECEVVCPEEAASESNLHGTFCIVLVEVERPILHTADPQLYRTLKSILGSAGGLLWVTNGGGQCPETPDSGTVHGLSRVLRTENNKLAFVTLALEIIDRSSERHVQNIIRIFKSTILGSTSGCYEPEYIEINGMPHINRIVEANDLQREICTRASSQQSRNQRFGEGPSLKLCIGNPGFLDTLHFQEDSDCTRPLAPDEVEVEVKAIGVNFRDCLIALGRENAKTFGSECAGIVRRVGEECDLQPGDRVSICNLDMYRTYARCPAQSVIRIPDELSLMEAAAIPTTFVTVYHALHEVARIKSGDSILIHAAAGGTGQAAIQVAKYFGAEVYVTVGSEQKKQLIMDLYGIPENRILYSRDLSFARGIKRLTQNRGVDIILNSLAGEGLVATWECIAPYGHFLEIGKKDIRSRNKLPMFPFAKNVSFSAIDIAAMSQERPSLVRKSFESAMALIATKKILPASPLHIFKISEIEQAFRFMQSGKNSGKIVIEVIQDDFVPVVLNTKPAYQFDQNATYVISGGLGGLGRSIARWMVGRGAKNLLLLSRSGPMREPTQRLITELKNKGVRVETPACDVGKISSLGSILRDYQRTMPPIKGCIQGAMVLRDAIFEAMSFDQWRDCIEPKIKGSWNLHGLLPKGMDFFILLSSICGVIGSGGQANYAAANTYQDALARYRVAHGEKATSLDLGVMLSEGFVAESDDLMRRLTSTGQLPPMSLNELFALLDYYCDPSLGPSTALRCQLVTGVEIPANLHARGRQEASWMSQPLFQHLYRIESTMATTSAGIGQELNFAALLTAASSLSEAGGIVTEALVTKLSKILSCPQEDLDISKPIHLYGVDSLVAVELRNWFAKKMNADVAVFDILGGASCSQVGILAAGKSQYRQATWVD